jgi:hypothetical protein
MVNFLHPESYDSTIKDVRELVKRILPSLKETINELNVINYEAFIAKSHTKLKESTVAREVVALKTKKEAFAEIVSILENILE